MTVGIYVAGSSYSRPPYKSTTQLLKYSEDGNLLWNRKYESNSTNSNYFSSLVLDNNNGVFATGSTSDSIYPQSDFLTIKYDTDGNTEWISRTNVDSTEFATSIVTDDFGNIFVSGYGSNPPNIKEMILIKYNSEGVLQWIRKFNGLYVNSTKHYTFPNMLAIENGRNIIVNFITVNNYNVNEIATLKYNGDGDLIWINKYSVDEDSSYQETRDIIVSENGNVFATAISQKYENMTNNTFAVLCYDSSGILKKIIRNENNFSKPFFPMASTISKNGSLVSTGYCFADSGSYVTDYFTVKYSLPIGIQTVSNSIPTKFGLNQNYPNPFNPSTVISYQLAVGSFTSLKIYNLLGKEVATLVNQKQDAGTYEIDFDAINLSSGSYFYILESENFVATKKMILLK